MEENTALKYVFAFTPMALVKTSLAPIERVRLVIQNQDTHPQIQTGEISRYKGLFRTIPRLVREQGLTSLWRGNLTDVACLFVNKIAAFPVKQAIRHQMPHSHDRGINMVLSNFAAGAGTAVTTFLTFPLSYARTRVALDLGTGPRIFTGPVDCIRRTYTSQGPTALCTGFGSSILGIVAYRAVYFGAYDSLRVLNPWNRDHGIAGFASRFAIAQLTSISAMYGSYPFDTACHRLQTQANKPKAERMYAGTWSCLRAMVRTEGFLGLWKGAGISVGKTLGSALLLVLFDQFSQESS